MVPSPFPSLQSVHSLLTHRLMDRWYGGTRLQGWEIHESLHGEDIPVSKPEEQMFKQQPYSPYLQDFFTVISISQSNHHKHASCFMKLYSTNTVRVLAFPLTL